MNALRGCSRVILMAAMIAAAGCRGSEDAAGTWIEREAQAFDDVADLDVLVSRAEGHRLILLGEATHGTEEFYRWRRKITQELVQRGAVHFIAVEGDWPAILELNLWVRGLGEHAGDDAAGRGLVAGLDRWPVWMWSNEQTLKLAEWLRAWNRDRPPEARVGLYGMDIYSPERAIASIVSGVSGDFDAAEDRDHACLEQAAATAGYRQWVGSGRSCEGELDARIAELESSAGAGDPDEGEPWQRHYLLESLRNVRQADLHFRASGGAEGWNSRASYFFGLVSRLLAHHGPSSAGVVWAHNTHIGDARATPMGRAGHVNIGQMAREALGDEAVFNVGFGTDRGEVVAARGWNRPMEVMPIESAKAGSLEAWMRDHGPDQFFALLDDPLPRRLGRAIPHRAVGVVWDGEDQYVPSDIGARYDAFVWIERTSRLRTLD